MGKSNERSLRCDDGDTNRYDYTYDALHRPVTRNADTFAYNRRGEVSSATVAGQSAAYAYDFIGNFTSATEGGAMTTYGANELNQYETVTEPDATLEPTYTPNGELSVFGPWTYAYDALSRLTEVRSNGVLVASNFYDHQGRRVRLVTQNATHTFLYDGWNVVLELVEHDGVTDRIEYYWGKDISGSLQGAGGVGGLLYLKLNGAIYVPFYDAYGNVMEYRASDGSVAASYVYDAFGRTISQTGPLADAFRFRHATKCFDVETCLYYYGYRFYSVIVRRWLTRDPKAEMASHNLYLFDSNNPNVCYDLLGMYILSYHNFGDPPPSGWGPQTDAFFSAKFKVPFARQINYAGGKIGYKVEFKPKESLFEIYLRKSFTFNAINDELDHLRCALLYEYGLDQFKIAVEKIHECPDVAARKYEDAETELGRAQDECEKCNNALDRKGGPHGH